MQGLMMATLFEHHDVTLNGIVLLLLFWILPFISGGSRNPCPMMNIEIDEHTQVGKVLFNFTTPATRLDLTPKGGLEGYLQLKSLPNNTYHIVLARDVDLNELNPTSYPVPNTNEQLQCNYSTGSTGRSWAGAVRAIVYTLRCEVSIHVRVTVTSSVTVAIRDVNDKAPFFLCAPYHKVISELTTVSTTVFTFSGLAADYDIDGGISGYSIVSGGEGVFVMSGAASDGFVVLQGMMDYDYGPRKYTLNISVTDTGEPPLSNWALLYITLADGDDQNPVFDHDIYYLSLPEHKPTIVNSSFLTDPAISAHDLDISINDTVAYALDTGYVHNGVSYFGVDHVTGQVTLLHVLDCDSKDQFIMRLKTYQVNSPTNRFSYATLIVTVEDINDHHPEILWSSYNVTVPENSPRGYHVVMIQAVDDDKGSNAVFAFHAIDPRGAFDITPHTGVLYVLNPGKLDREIQDTFNVTVYTEETASFERHRSDNVTVTINLSDTNDNSPSFLNDTYRFTVSSLASVNSSIGRLSAIDLDQGRNAEVHYQILFASKEAQSIFSLDGSTGTISTLKPLNKPYVELYILTIEARDQPVIYSQSRSCVAKVTIAVKLANEHAPHFIGAPYHVTVTEATPGGSSFLQLQATDEDGDVDLLYGDPKVHPSSKCFSVDRHSGWVYTLQPLDREHIDSFTLQMVVSDGKHNTTTNVTVTVEDVNDNNPEFHQATFVFNVTEEMPPGVTVGHIQAEDRDIGVNADIEYMLAGTRVAQEFLLDPLTGALTTRRSLDREDVSQYQFLVVARDGGNTSRSTFVNVIVNIIDINDNVPVFHKDTYNVTVLEKSTPGDILQLQAQDADSAEYADIFYAISHGNTSLFGIDVGDGTLFTRVTFDLSGSSKLSLYSLTIIAFNIVPFEGVGVKRNVTAQVTVHVLDLNDNSPVFTRSVYNFVIKENIAVGSTVGRVIAVDDDDSRRNSVTQYWLSDIKSPAADKFMVDMFTGLIRVKQSVDRDAPSAETYFVFKVVASDMVPAHDRSVIQNVTAIVNITIMDINDNAPTFSNDLYTIELLENATVGSDIGLAVEAHDKDIGAAGSIMFELLPSQSPFMVDRQSGHLYVAVSLDYDDPERPSTYTLTLLAVDSGQSPLTGTATVRVNIMNVNDNRPIFSQSEYHFTVAENEAAGHVVGRLHASDPDGDVLLYEILVGAGDMFAISSNGELRLLSSLDYELSRLHSLVVRASDNYSSSGEPYNTMVSVIVTVVDRNDNRPTFEHDHYYVTISEDTSNTTILKVEATDADSGRYGAITYYIVSGNDDGLFRLESSSGQLEVTNSTLLDHGQKPQHILVIQAKDGGVPSLSCLTEVVVAVIDVNNHAPQFQHSLYKTEVLENESPGTMLLQVTATDEDSTSKLRYSLKSDSFTIDILTGRITTLVSLDRELTSSYLINISVSDGRYVDSASVSIVVLDTNDNSPEFSKETFYKSIMDNVEVGTSLLTVQALDADLLNNGVVTYWFRGTDGKFDIDPVLGVIKISGSVDARIKHRYTIIVFARDHGYPSLLSNASVVINVNESQKELAFKRFNYYVSVQENASLNVEILKVKLSTNRLPISDIRFEISKGDVNDSFGVDVRGALGIMKPLDFEVKRYYSLTISAVDTRGLASSASVIVRVAVTDINDNTPVFLPWPKVIRLHGPLDQGEVIFKVIAMDADSGENGDVTYSIVGNTQNVNFTIDSHSGEIITNSVLSVGLYNINIMASDHGHPSLSSSLRLELNVLDDAGVAVFPLFHQTWYSVYVNESVTVPHILEDVNAVVGNSGNDTDVYYTMDDKVYSGQFQVNSRTGELSVTRPLDRETVNMYSVVVTAYNRLEPSYSSETLIIINVTDTNDEIPAFIFSQYDVTIAENAPVNTTVATLQAFDPDLSSELAYYVLYDESGGVFHVTSKDNLATVLLHGGIDREAMDPSLQGIYSVWLRVSDGPHSGVPVLLTVNVEDVNDNWPRFEQTLYNVSVSEGLRACKEIIRVVAMDEDITDFNQLRYVIVEGDENDLFELADTTGTLSLSCDSSMGLDKETRDRHLLKVIVIDKAGHEVATVVNITVLDVNDNPPVFTSSQVTAYTFEGQESLSLSVPLLATDADSGENSVIIYSLLPNQQHEFVVTTDPGKSPAKGMLHVRLPLDREKASLYLENGTAVYTVTVVATDNGTPPMSASAVVTIYVRDINDNAPSFDTDKYEVSLSENSPPGTSVVTVTAQDSDLSHNTHLRYSIQGQDVFIIERDSGVVRLQRPLSVLAQSQYTLTLAVTDGIYNSTAELRVTLLDVNDHSPVFDQALYHFTIIENNLLGTTAQFVGHVSASDKDQGVNGVISYNIASGNTPQLFLIAEPAEGSISVIGQLDRETKSHHTLIVTATDQGSPTRMNSCVVEIEVLDANDNTPIFTSAIYRGTVYEHAGHGTIVSVMPQVLATDRDVGLNAAVTYSQTGTGSSLFYIDPTAGTVTVSERGGGLLDRETKHTYVLEIQATDRRGEVTGRTSTSVMTIELLDINDHTPMFEQHLYNFSVNEAAGLYTPLGAVMATDRDVYPNNRVVYSVVDGGEGRFSVNRHTGEIIVSGILDRESRQQYTLNVSASDLGIRPAPLQGYTLVSVTVDDFNDNSPEFDRSGLSLSVSENVLPPATVGQVTVTDTDTGDNGVVTCMLNTTAPFSLTPDSGLLVAMDKLDREMEEQYHLVIVCIDHGHPQLSSTATLTISVQDMNDHSPVFQQTVYRVQLLDRSPVGSVILYPLATDLDSGLNAVVTYSLHGHRGEETYFNIDSKTGLISIAQQIRVSELLGGETNETTLELAVRATDGGSPPRTSEATMLVSVVDVGDRSLWFRKDKYHVTVPEDSRPGSFVFTVEAVSDGATQVFYKLSENLHFLIKEPHSVKGVIYMSDLTLDRETEDEYRLMLTAVDSGIPQKTAYALVTVHVADINDNLPQFEQATYKFKVTEGIFEGHHDVGLVHATDADLDENGQLLYSVLGGNETGVVFDVDRTSGKLRVIGILDRELRDNFTITVQVTDQGNPPLSNLVEVSIAVVDVNDNAPLFEGAPYVIHMSEMTQPGNQILEVQVSDTDAGLNGFTNINLKESTDQLQPFYIENRAGGVGIVRLAVKLSHIETPSYNVTLVASDLGLTPLTSSTWLWVNITEGADDKPYFLRDVYEVRLSEDMHVGSGVITLMAGTGQYQYEIIGGNTEGLFDIAEHSGMVTVAQPMNIRTDSMYELIITASDTSTPPATAKTKLRITVAASQSMRVFEVPVYEVDVRENVAPPTLLIDLNATFEMAGRPVEYHIISSYPDGLFNIDNNTGELWCMRPLDRETAARYELTIGCRQLTSRTQRQQKRDTTGPTDKVTVQVAVSDENDNVPQFSENPVLYGMSVDAPVNQLIATLQVTDADDGDNSACLFMLQQHADSEFFYVAPSTGALHSKVSLLGQHREQFEITVNATDNWGKGQSAQVTIKVVLMLPDQRAVMVAGLAPNSFTRRLDGFIANLSDILSWQVRVEKLEPHVTQMADGLDLVDHSMSDLYFYAVDNNSSSIVSRSEILERINSRSQQLKNLFRRNEIREVKPVGMEKLRRVLGSAEMVMIVLACLVVCGSVLGILILVLTDREQKEVNKNLLPVGSKPSNHDNDTATSRQPVNVATPSPLYHQPEHIEDAVSIDSDSHQLQENPRAVEDPWAMSCSSSQPRASHASASLGRLHQDYHLQTPSDSPRAPHRHTPGRVVGQSVTPHRIPVGIVTSPGISAALRGKTACVPRVQGCHNSDRGKTACVPRVQGRHNSDRGKVNFRLTNKGCCDKVNERHPWADNLLLLPGSTQPVRMELGQFPSPATAPSGSHTEGVKNATEGVSDRLGVKNVTEGVSDRLGVKISGKYSGLEQRNIHQVAPLFIECDSRYVRRLDYFCPPHTEAYSNIAAHRNAACNTSHMANHARFDPRKSLIAGNGLLKQSRVQPMAKSQYENHIDSDQRKCITFDNVAYQDDSASYAKKTHCPLVLEGTAGHYNRHINSTNL